MTPTIRRLSLKTYRDDDGNPCCACNFATGEVCQFYRTRRFGTLEECAFVAEELQRRRDGKGTLIPRPTCPLWQGQQATTTHT